MYIKGSISDKNNKRFRPEIPYQEKVFVSFSQISPLLPKTPARRLWIP
jgi:hypothetical protein